MGIILPQPRTEIGTYDQCKDMTPSQRLEVTRNLVMTSTRQGLEKMREIIDHEIYLSDKAIEEGQEEDDRDET